MAAWTFISPNPQSRLSTAGRTPLKGHSGIKIKCARSTAASTLSSHLKSAATPRTREADQGYLVVESPGALDKPAGLLPHSKRQGDDLTAEPPVGVQFETLFVVHSRHDGSIFCWCLGVNFRPHSLHRRIRLTPRLLVLREPLPLDLEEPQWMQVGGLPLPINITSRDMGGTLLYKDALSLGRCNWMPIEMAFAGTYRPRALKSNLSNQCKECAELTRQDLFAQRGSFFLISFQYRKICI